MAPGARSAVSCLNDSYGHASQKRTRPQAHGVNLRVPFGLESHFGPVRHEWLYPKAPKIIESIKTYHDDNLGTLSAGVT